jgi:hypothetical protein
MREDAPACKPKSYRLTAGRKSNADDVPTLNAFRDLAGNTTMQRAHLNLSDRPGTDETS